MMKKEEEGENEEEVIWRSHLDLLAAATDYACNCSCLTVICGGAFHVFAETVSLFGTNCGCLTVVDGM